MSKHRSADYPCGSRHTSRVRIATWNLAGRWDRRHLALIDELDCDILLLTEVSERVELSTHDVHFGEHRMMPKRRWAAVASRLPMRPAPDPHGASAMVEVNGVRICSSILPWRSCGSRFPWVGSTTAERTAIAVAEVGAQSPVVWGGDWNHALAGREWSGSVAGRRALLAAIDRLGLQVPTASLPHQIDGLLTIDHIAVPQSWNVDVAERHRAISQESRLSDHDLYVVEVRPTTV